MSTTPNWFDIDRDGLRKVAMRHGPGFILLELIQNTLDENVTEVTVVLEPIEGRRGRARLVVTDNSPEGFSDLRHAYTMYGGSPKQSDPTKRGFMDIGEKHVLACCEEAEIRTTTGTVTFPRNQASTVNTRRRTTSGTVFEATVVLKRPEVDQAIDKARMVIPPPDVSVSINGVIIDAPERLSVVPGVSLMTTLPDDEGVMRYRTRKTTLHVYRAPADRLGWLFEMGMPVVETGDEWDVDVQQRVPLNSDRNNVPPAFLRSVRVAVLEAMHTSLTHEIAVQTWVKEALGDARTSNDAAKAVIHHRYGPNAVAADPSDREATNNAISHDYTVVWGGALSKDEWSTVRRAEALVPAGQVFPTEKPYSDDPNAPMERIIDPRDWTSGMRRVVDLAHRLAGTLLGHTVDVRIVNEPHVGWLANYGEDQSMAINAGRLGRKWFDGEIDQKHVQLILHEFGHDIESNHLSDKYYEAVASLGAKLAFAVVANPEILSIE
jgi:hypothetical protein